MKLRLLIEFSPLNCFNDESNAERWFVLWPKLWRAQKWCVNFHQHKLLEREIKTIFTSRSHESLSPPPNATWKFLFMKIRKSSSHTWKCCQSRLKHEKFVACRFKRKSKIESQLAVEIPDASCCQIIYVFFKRFSQNKRRELVTWKMKCKQRWNVWE